MAPPVALFCRSLRVPSKQQPAGLVFVLAETRDKARQPQGQQPPVEIVDDLEQIGKRDGEGHRPAVEFDHHRIFRRRGEAQRVGDGVEFVEGEGNENPVVAPAVVEQIRHQLRLALFHAGIVDLADFQPSFHSGRFEMRGGWFNSSRDRSKR